jgi:hypothetical protein
MAKPTSASPRKYPMDFSGMSFFGMHVPVPVTLGTRQKKNIFQTQTATLSTKPRCQFHVVGLLLTIPVVPHKAVAEVSKIGNL